jgi:hypothetical protein
MYCAVSADAKWPQLAAQRDTLLQLPIIALLERVQLRLARQNDLQHLAAPVLQIPEQPDFLEHIPFEILRFVDDQHGRLVLIGARISISFSANRTSVFESRALEIEIVRKHLEELLRGEPRIEEESEGRLVRRQMVAQTFEHRRLARAHFARQNDEAFAALHAVNQARQRLFVLRAAIQKRRIGTEIERVLFKPKNALYIPGNSKRNMQA